MGDVQGEEALQMTWRLFVSAISLAIVAAAELAAQDTFEPKIGQSGKDVVWVPTSPELLEVMLDMADVRPTDVVVDLGSGDGRNVIAAAKRGARARGVEFNPDMVALSRRLAQEAGVADKATFVEGDMYVADISDASVLALFLLPHNLERLSETFLALAPGTRIVVNTYPITGWVPERTERLEPDCSSWCTAMLYVVPAQVQGAWRLPDADLLLTQQVQRLSGTLTVAGREIPVTDGKVTGTAITFTAGDAVYSGEVNGDRITGTTRRGEQQTNWTAARRP
jgi:SAM-dependent methyltransferase